MDIQEHDLRLAATGQSQDAYTTSTNTSGADVEWRLVANGQGIVLFVSGTLDSTRQSMR